MNQSRKKGQSAWPRTSAPVRWRIPSLAALVMVVAVVAAVGFWWSKSHQAGTNAENQNAPAANPKALFEKLIGRWQRPDGGYIIEIRSVEPGGRMNVAYFNPQPINVAKAEVSRIGGTFNVFIELRDVNYPGSTYNLTYDAVGDCLRGIYLQAAIKQTFDVYFARLQP